MKNVLNYFYIVKEILKKTKRKNEIGRMKTQLERKQASHHDIQEVFGNILNKLKISLEVKGTENVPTDKPVLFVCNHQGNFDILVLLTASPVPISFIAKKELKKIPVIRKWMEYMDCLFIDRSKSKESIRMIDETTKNMNEKGSFVLFPEGTRSKKKEMNPFKRGGLNTALKNGVTVIPVTIDGTYHVMEEKKGKLQQSNVRLVFHSPMNFDIKKNYTDEIEKLQNVIRSEL